MHQVWKSLGSLQSFFFGQPFARCAGCGRLSTLDQMTATRLGYFCNADEARGYSMEQGLPLAGEPVRSKNQSAVRKPDRRIVPGSSAAR